MHMAPQNAIFMQNFAISATSVYDSWFKRSCNSLTESHQSMDCKWNGDIWHSTVDFSLNESKQNKK